MTRPYLSITLRSRPIWFGGFRAPRLASWMPSSGTSTHRSGLDHAYPMYGNAAARFVERARNAEWPASIFKDRNGKTEPFCILGRIAHAIIERKPGKKYAREPALAQIARKPRRRFPVVFEEGRIRIDVQPESLAQDERSVGDSKRGMQPGARRSLDAMVRPERLQAIARLNRLIGTSAGMRGSKGAMPRRMPVLCQDNVVELAGKPVDGCKDFAALRHRKLAARTKIILNIDDQKDVGRCDGKGALHKILPLTDVQAQKHWASCPIIAFWPG